VHLIDADRHGGHWGTKAIVDLINEAASGAAGPASLTAESVALTRANESSSGGRKLGFQAAAGRIVLRHYFPDNFAFEFARRLCLWLPDARADENLENRIQTTLQTLRAFRPAFVIAFIKIMCNGLSTSCRRQELDKGCLFGCGCNGNDKLYHYFFCPCLWTYLPAFQTRNVIPTWSGKLGLVPEHVKESIISLHILVEAYQCQYASFSSNFEARFRDATRRTNILMPSPNQEHLTQTRNRASSPASLAHARRSDSSPAPRAEALDAMAARAFQAGISRPTSFGGLA